MLHVTIRNNNIISLYDLCVSLAGSSGFSIWSSVFQGGTEGKALHIACYQSHFLSLGLLNEGRWNNIKRGLTKVQKVRSKIFYEFV